MSDHFSQLRRGRSPSWWGRLKKQVFALNREGPVRHFTSAAVNKSGNLSLQSQTHVSSTCFPCNFNPALASVLIYCWYKFSSGIMKIYLIFISVNVQSHWFKYVQDICLKCLQIFFTSTIFFVCISFGTYMQYAIMTMVINSSWLAAVGLIHSRAIKTCLQDRHWN